MLAHLFVVLLLFSPSVLIGVSSQPCQREITVDVTSNGSLTIPMVPRVTLVSSRLTGSDITWTSESDGANMTNSSYSVDTSGYTGDNFTVTDGQFTLNLNLNYDSDAMTCHYLTLDVEYSRGASLNFSCLPVTSCGEDVPSFTSIIWMKSFSRDNEYSRRLSSGIYEPPEFTNLRMDSDRNDIVLSSGNLNGSSITDAVLDIGNPSMLSVGYYSIYGFPNMEILHSFTVFRAVSRLESTSEESLSITKGTQDPYKGIYCVYRSFPPATVTWVRGSDRDSAQSFERNGIEFTNIIEDDTRSNYTASNGAVDFTYTLFGGVVFEELQYEDTGFYYCSATNGYSTSDEEHIRLRVRDPLRPLWPALGIIAVFIITALFIVAGAIGDKLRDSRNSSLEPQEINAAFSVRSQRVSVTDDDSSPKRRTSSTVQLLPKPE